VQIPNEIIEEIAVNDKFFDLAGLKVYSSLGLSTLRSFIKKNGLPHYAIKNNKGAVTKILVKKSEFDYWMVQQFKTDINAIADEVIRQLQ
jgi:hypothetical protein